VGTRAFREGVQVIALTSDWHLGDGGSADDSCDKGIRWAVDAACGLYPLDALVLAGDTFELWQFDLMDILWAKRRLLAWIDKRLSENHVPLILLPGNHDGVPVQRLLCAMRLEMPYADISGTEGPLEMKGWRISHGDEWDVFNKRGPLRPLSHAVTAFAGLVERVIPGVDEQWMNPRNWPRRIADRTSPAQSPSERMRRNVYREAYDYAVTHKVNVAHGHTHRRTISQDRKVVCCGACCEGRGEFAALWQGGNAVLHSMGA
jgi:UDP-2,3-diacylglucosamine pyrophosphatase LpxH